MTAPPKFAEFAAVLRSLLDPYRDRLVVTADQPGELQFDTRTEWRGRPLYFGGVKVGARYVSYHLMPVYMYPDLLDGISDALRHRMQGKSCFNFTTPDDALVAELAELTDRGVQRLEEAGQL